MTLPPEDQRPTRHVIGEVYGPRRGEVHGRTVRRYREDGSLDWFTVHLTRWGARRAARLYERTGRVKGSRP